MPYPNKRKRPNKKQRVNVKPIAPAINPAATLQSLKTIANLIEYQKKLVLSNKSVQPYQVPSVGYPARFTAPRANLRVPTTSTSTNVQGQTSKSVQSNAQTSTPVKTNIQTSEPVQTNVQTSKPVQTNAQTSKPVQTNAQTSKPVQTNVQTSKPVQANEQTPKPESSTQNEKPTLYNPLKKTKFTIVQKQQPMLKDDLLKRNNELRKSKSAVFDDFEAYTNSSFIDFEESDKVVDLNDDDLFQSNDNTVNNDKKNTIKPSSQTNFQEKLQQQYAKKMETKLQSETNDSPGNDKETTKQSNKELPEGLTADIKTEKVQDTGRWDIKTKNPSQNPITPIQQNPPQNPKTPIQQNPISSIQQNPSLNPKTPIQLNPISSIQQNPSQKVSKNAPPSTNPYQNPSNTIQLGSQKPPKQWKHPSISQNSPQNPIKAQTPIQVPSENPYTQDLAAYIDRRPSGIPRSFLLTPNQPQTSLLPNSSPTPQMGYQPGPNQNPMPLMGYQPGPNPAPAPLMGYQPGPNQGPVPLMSYEAGPNPGPAPLMGYQPGPNPNPVPLMGYQTEPNPGPAPLMGYQPVQNQVIFDSKLYVQTNVQANQPQAYSPTDVYQDIQTKYEPSEEPEGSMSPNETESGQKRTSAFQRLGPLAAPKKPKLTINLDQEGVREVVDETNKDIPVYDREDINASTDEIVKKFLPFWPWKKSISIKKSVTARISKVVTLMEQEQMEELYDNNLTVMLTVLGYPTTWTKENVLDMLLDSLKDKSFIPCFIEEVCSSVLHYTSVVVVSCIGLVSWVRPVHSPGDTKQIFVFDSDYSKFTTKECKFFVLGCRSALLNIHSLSFSIRKDDVELLVTISIPCFTLRNLNFDPKCMFRKILRKRHEDGKLDLSEFTLKYDISHFIYFPLHRTYNQTELIEMHTGIMWENLTEINLSHNKISSIDRFKFERLTPRLRIVDISHNNLDTVIALLPWRYLPIQKLNLQNNPLCLNYIDPQQYVKVVKTMFSGLRELDGEIIPFKGEMPPFKQNYCSPEANHVVSKFLEVYFPLLEVEADARSLQGIYHKDATMTITCTSKLRHSIQYKAMRNLLIKSQIILEDNCDIVEGASNISRLLEHWPNLEHDPTTFTVDVMYHDDNSTVFKITGVVKVTSSSLADDEPILAFGRTIHLRSKNRYEYKIRNEMVFWDEPTAEYGNCAFKALSIPKKTISLKFESPPDEESKEKLISIFMKITELNKIGSERCLESKDWHLRDALEYFMKLLKLDNIQSLMNP